MRVIVTGSEGQLGSDVCKELVKRGHIVIGTDIIQKDKSNYLQLDITKREEVIDNIVKINPDLIIHCAAWTRVDDAEDNAEIVDLINHLGTRYIAEAARAVNASMIYISTDYVFNGEGTRPWQPDDKNYDPINVYGKSKLDGEIEVSSILNKYFIIRIAWVFGLNGKNFIKTMVDVGKKHSSVRVVNDQIGTPTYTKDLARLLADMSETQEYGYYHVTNEGEYVSWFDYCKEIYRQVGLNVQVIPVLTEEYGLSKAMRPKNSRLDRSRLVQEGFIPLPDWKDAVNRYLKEIGEV